LRRADETLRRLGLRPDADGKLKPTKGGLADRWRDRAVSEITAHEVDAIIDHARHKSAYGLEPRQKGFSESRARATHAALSAFFAWLARRRKVAVSPLANLAPPETPEARDRVLTEAEVKKFWKATDQVAELFGHVLKLLLLTGQRRDEVAEMRWAELSDDLTTWTIPKERTKNKRSHVVPLAPAARDIIRAVKRTSDVFVFSTTGSTPVSGWSKVKRRLDSLMGVEPWRVHDLRRTAVTGMAELNISTDVIELTVNHVSGSRGGIAGVYNRSEKIDERRKALEAWSNKIDIIVKGRPANVVKLQRGGEAS
jgi:integrase